jgi:hypothetical protein
MNCTEFDLLIVSDEPEVAAALRDHASGCPRCATILAGQADLRQEVEAWVDSTPAPPPELEQRILQAVRQQAGAADAAPAPAPESGQAKILRFRSRPVFTWGAVAAAAMILVAALVVARAVPWAQAPVEADRLLVAEALEEAVQAERAHARAIARLEQAAAPVLARANDPNLPASKAAILLSYRDRLASLDSTIAEIESFLEGNQSNSGGRTVLLAAYTEKTEVLGQVIALEEEWAS